MKKFFLPAVFFSLLFASCSTDDTLTQDATPSNKREAAANTSATIYKDGQTADYRANPYDNAGKLYNEVYLAAVAQNPSATLQTIVTATDNAALANEGFTALAAGYNGITTTQVQWVIENANSTSVIVNSVTTSTAGRQKLNDLLTLLNSVEGQSFPEIYGSIVNFEQTIPGNASLTATDRQILFTTASIARYSHRNRPPNLEWIKIKTGIYGAVSGADTDMQHAITKAVAVQLAP